MAQPPFCPHFVLLGLASHQEEGGEVEQHEQEKEREPREGLRRHRRRAAVEPGVDLLVDHAAVPTVGKKATNWFVYSGTIPFLR